MQIYFHFLILTLLFVLKLSRIGTTLDGGSRPGTLGNRLSLLQNAQTSWQAKVGEKDVVQVISFFLKCQTVQLICVFYMPDFCSFFVFLFVGDLFVFLFFT